MPLSRRIIGIVLVKNEDIFVTAAIRNVIEFCDEIMVLDNFSDDGTWARLQALAAEFPRKIMLMRIQNAKQSHRLLQGYAGQNVFVFGVDGDEIYDPAGLERMRRKVMGGAYDNAWCLYGHVLHCTGLDFGTGLARGYRTPAARSMTKLYNFSVLESWDEPNQQRLHGRKKLFFKEGFSTKSSVRSFQKKPWDEMPYRCLHMCFLPRSTAAAPDLENLARRNISEIHTGRDLGAGWKATHYAVGEQVEHRLKPFFGPLPEAEREHIRRALVQALPAPSPLPAEPELTA